MGVVVLEADDFSVTGAEVVVDDLDFSTEDETPDDDDCLPTPVAPTAAPTGDTLLTLTAPKAGLCFVLRLGMLVPIPLPTFSLCSLAWMRKFGTEANRINLLQ